MAIVVYDVVQGVTAYTLFLCPNCENGVCACAEPVTHPGYTYGVDIEPDVATSESVRLLRDCTADGESLADKLASILGKALT